MDHNLLVSELQALAVETKRRHAEVKDAAEAALEVLSAGPPPRPPGQQQAEVLLAPITLGCRTKTPKIIGISIAALQRLVALQGVPTAALPGVLQTLTSVAGQGVDIQLKILQTLLAVLTFMPDVHDEVLGNALLICFKLHDSKVSVVSSTAAATLRQAVMVVFDRVASTAAGQPTLPLTLKTDPPAELNLSANAMDTYNILSDLCLLTAAQPSSSGFWGGGGDKEKPKLLKLSSLSRTFGLELIESILSGYEEGVKKRPELLFVVQHSLDPLLLRLLAEKPSFPVALRVCRILYLLVRSFIEQLPHQVETYLSTLIRMGMGEAEHDEHKKDTAAPWLRVLALEILRGICGDTVLLQTIWTHYDQPEGPRLFGKLVSSLGRLVNEKPSLLGIGTQMHGLGLPTVEGSSFNPGYLDMGLGMVASAASVGMSTVGSMIGTQGAGLGPQSAMKLRLIEQHDKVEAPMIPETYIYLLALQSLDAVAEGIHTIAGQTTEPNPQTVGLAESAWPALLAAQSFCIATNLSDNLFAEVLNALQNFTVACGLLGLRTPRDAFLNTLGKYAVPPQLVSAMQAYLESGSQRNTSGMAGDTLGIGAALGVSGPAGPPAMSERNLACLKSTVAVARFLAGSLGSAWHDVLETLQNANFMLAPRRPNMNRKPTAASPQLGYSGSLSPVRSRSSHDEARPEVFEDLEVEVIQIAINSLFDSTSLFDDASFTTFLSALCRLSSEMVGLDTAPVIDLTHSPATPTAPFSPGSDRQRRRTSGINISHTIKSGDRSFSLTKLRVVGMLNITRLVSREPSVGWTMFTQHLLAVARHATAPSTIRIQASDALNEFLLAAIRTGKESRVQHQVFDVLVRQVDVNPVSHLIATDYDVRATGFQTLNQILESSGHALEVGWKTIFGMLNNVCRESTSSALQRTNSSSSVSSERTFTVPPPAVGTSKGDAALVRIAFPSLNLICTDFLSSLDPAAMRQCISCLGCYGRQKDDVNITLAAIGLLWNVSDVVQAGETKDLWLVLLTELLELGRDPRLEVRSSAMQTLFRCVDLYGSNLSSDLWEDVLWKVVFPLLDAARGDEAHVLALNSIGGIFGTFLPNLLSLSTFGEVYDKLLDQLRQAFVSSSRACSTASLKALERILTAFTSPDIPSDLSDRVFDRTWLVVSDLASAIPTCEPPYTQDNLLALVRVAKILHDRRHWAEDDLRQLSQLLRTAATYAKSPDYRPDVDQMSPLQACIGEIIATSSQLGPTIVLGDLAEYASLAYVGDGGDQGGKLSFVGLSKWAMPRLAEVFGDAAADETIYDDGTVESVLGAYAIPIKLKYDCPAPSKFGEDQPLWRTAMTAFCVVLGFLAPKLGSIKIEQRRFEAIWAQITAVFSAILLDDNPDEVPDDDEDFVIRAVGEAYAHISPQLAVGDDRIPDQVLSHYSDTLLKASQLYRYTPGAHVDGGTTAPTIGESNERMRYWAFDRLIEAVSATKAVNGQDSTERPPSGSRLARLAVGSLLKRFETPLKQFLADAKLRGQMPFPRVREDEMIYILRHLISLRLTPGTAPTPASASSLASAILGESSRAHLFHLYPLLLELSFVPAPVPSIWVFPSEYAQLLSVPGSAETGARGLINGDRQADEDADGYDAGDGADLIKVDARDFARRCLELVGEEMGLSSNLREV